MAVHFPTSHFAARGEVLPNPDFVKAIKRFCETTETAPSRFGRDAVGDPRFVGDLLNGRAVKSSTRQRVEAFIEAAIAALDSIDPDPDLEDGDEDHGIEELGENDLLQFAPVYRADQAAGPINTDEVKAMTLDHENRHQLVRTRDGWVWEWR